MAFRRERNIREMYEERFHPERSAPYPRGVAGERRPAFGRPDDDYSRGFEYDGPRFYPNGGPRSYHGDDQRAYHGDGHHSFSNEPRGGPPGRREDYPYYRGPREEPHSGRQMDFRGSSRVGPPHNARVQGSYPAPRSLSALGPDPGDDTLMQAIMNLDRGEEREGLRRKAPFPQVRDRSPPRRDVPPSPHSRSGSSISSRSYSPERGKGHPYQPPQGKSMDFSTGHPFFLTEGAQWREFPHPQATACVMGFEESYGPSRSADRDRGPGTSVIASRDGSPHSTVSASKEDMPATEPPPDEPLATADEAPAVMDDFQERRSQAIAAKAREIEKDCETFGMVVKMLVSKEPSLEKHLQTPLKENLSDIRERCLEDLRHFISELDEVVRPPDASA
ncbi:periphilin-1 isoform X2 [Electrophorus electricus]|uniref:periphilin-1 isoform X2 n=1 Tax=Electrophorus electricus TaxID=8005 RepID=UPI0015D004AE|nr:periphilin-1 isoform X2 [Electrophorus electricus]